MCGRPLQGVAAALLVFLCMGVCGGLRAQDAPAPSLALPEDPSPPRPSLGVAVDPLAVAFGRYGVHVAVAVGRAHGLWLTPAWVRGMGPALEVGYHAWPLGRGLVGLFVGPLAGVGLGTSALAWRAAWVGGEAGYQHAWSGFLLGAAVGGLARWSSQEGARAKAELRVRLVLGWAWSSA